jgi:hypothetical protein
MNTPPNQTEFESAPSKRDYTVNDLFPETLPPVMAAHWPTTGTRAYEALAALLDGVQNQADYWKGWRLSAYVKTLEYAGWIIDTRLIVKPGCRAKIAEYRLDLNAPSVIAALAIHQGVTQ